MTDATRHDRPFFLGKLGLFFLIALVLLVSLLLYLQTRHGFRHVIVPLAAKLTGARLEVRDGLLSLRGTLEVDGLVYDDSMVGLSFEAERVALHAAPWSFLKEGVPRIEDLELTRAKLRMVLRPEPTGGPVQEPDTRPAGTLRLLPITIEQARFDDVTVSMVEGDRRITGQVAATLDQLGPGRLGHVML